MCAYAAIKTRTIIADLYHRLTILARVARQAAAQIHVYKRLAACCIIHARARITIVNLDGTIDACIAWQAHATLIIYVIIEEDTLTVQAIFQIASC